MGSSNNTNGAKVAGIARIGLGSSSSPSISSNERTSTPPAAPFANIHPILLLRPFLIRVIASPSITPVPTPLPLLHPPLAGCIVCLSPYLYTDTHAFPITITITIIIIISIPVIASPNAAATAPATATATATAITATPPTTAVRKTSSDPFPPLQISLTRIIVMVGSENAAGGRGGSQGAH
ncbi:hypothetical protein BU17DRAFT_83700 [Hysterangium stoloniferum]|nr:hypothetical protein BU17DRAFT_83700 [Hysterangium stoloniferum]